MRQSLTNILDYFYPPFRRFMPVQTFRYAACGGGNTILGLSMYFIGYHFIFQKTLVVIGSFAFKPHMAALFLSGAITFIIGFILNKFIVFTGSNIASRIQLFRYFLSFSLNLILNYSMLKLLIEWMSWAPFISQLFTTIVLIIISYLTQKKFTFKVK